MAGLLFVLFGIGIGSLIIFPTIRALNETTYTISETGDSQFLYGDTDGVTATVADVTLSKDDNWFDLGWTKKKQVTIKNLSAIALTTGTSMQISVNTKSLFDNGSLKTNCEDLRVIYAPSAGTNTEIKRSYFVNSGATNCSNSTNTTLTFPLQADLDISATDDKYYIYYSNSSATNPNYGDDGYDIGDAQATLVCPFNGTATCVDGETPTTATGAIRYSGGSAMQFDGNYNTPDKIVGPSLPTVTQYTIEGWYKNPGQINTYPGLYGGWGGFDGNDVNGGLTGTGILTVPGIGPMISSSGIPSDGNYHHLVLQYDGETFKIFIDGQNVASSVRTVNIPSGGFYIGLRSHYRGFNGEIDEFRISKVARYSENFTPSITPFETDSDTLVLYHFDENGEDPRFVGKAMDSSGNGNHGTITGAKYVSGLVGVDSSTSQTGAITASPFASHQGIFVEEGTTNLVTNPSFENSTTYNTNWNLPETFILEDQYTTTRTAAALNGTTAEPTGQIRTAINTSSKITITSGKLNFATGATVNDGVWYPVQSRVAGKMLVATITPSDTNGDIVFGWDTNQTGAINDAIKFTASGVLQVIPNGGTAMTVGSYTATTYQVSAVLRSNGVFWYIKGGTFTNWTLLITTTGGTGDGYPAIQAGSITSIFTVDNIRIPTSTWLPTPLVYDSFTRADGLLGSSETPNPDLKATPQLAWAGSTWSISGNKVINTPNLGNELIANGSFENGNPPTSWSPNAAHPTYERSNVQAQDGSYSLHMITGGTNGGFVQYPAVEANKWYVSTGYMYKTAPSEYYNFGLPSYNFVYQPVGQWQRLMVIGTASAGLGMFAGPTYAAEVYYDNFSTKAISLPEMFATVSSAKADVVAEIGVTLQSTSQNRTPSGMVLRLDSTTNPQNFLLATINGGGANAWGTFNLSKYVSGTYTSLLSTDLYTAGTQYSAGTKLSIVMDGTLVRAYYGGRFLGSTTVTDTGILNNTLHGAFSANPADSVDNFQLWASGSQGEYNILPVGLTISENTTSPFYKFGSKSVRLENNGAQDLGYTTSIDPNSTASHTISAYVYDATSGNIGGTVTSSIAKLAFNSAIVTPSAYTDMGGGWWRLTYSAAVPDTLSNYGVAVVPGKTVYVDGVQLETKSHASTYADGSMGNEYAWVGGSDGSNSTRTIGDLRYSVAGNISNVQGAFSFWVKPRESGWNSLFDTSLTIGCGYLNLVHSGNMMYLYDSCTNQIARNVSWSNGTWKHLVVAWGTNSLTLYINGVEGTPLVTFNNRTMDSIYIGRGGLSTISDFRIYNQQLTSNEISSLYQSGLQTHTSGSEDNKRYKPTGTWESSILNLTANGRWGETPNFLTNETLNGNSINYQTRTSLDGINWSAYAPVLGADTEYSVDSPPNKFVQVKATLNSPNQNTTPVLNSIAMNFVQDNTPPPINTDNIVMKRTEDGGQIVEGSWTNSPSPYFFWDEVDDDQDGSGMRGYCLAISDSPLANPATSKGPFLGNSPVPTAGSTCGFIISTNYINFENDNYKSEDWLVASNSSYYLAIKAVDNTGNVYAGDAQVFEFKFDDIPPDNVTSISTPREAFANINDIYVNWPTSGNAAAKDSNSQLLGYQISINNEVDWIGVQESTSLGINYIPLDYLQPFFFEAERDGENFQIGNNTVYFRAIDIAGNFSTLVRSALVAYSGEAPNFPPSSIVTVNPTSSEINNFSFSWPAAIPAEGSSVRSYYYMINTTPPSSLSTILSNSSLYIPTTNTSVPTGNVAGLVKGENTITVVVVDNNGNYSQSNFVTAEFELNSTTPDPAKNLTLSDASIKSASLWRVALAWADPDYKGTGSLSYKIERSIDGISWQSVVVVTGNSFVDTVPESKTYYYRVGAMDNSDLSKNNPSYTLGYSILPKGSYSIAAKLTSEPEVTEVTTRRATIKWTTERNSDSKIAYGTNQGKYFPEEFANSNQLTNHILTLTNLLPSTTYYYLAKWTDEDGNTGVSKELTFTTEPAPIVKDVVVKNVSIDRASISFSTKSAVRVKLYYGKTTSFGAITELSISQSASSYTLPLEALEDGTKYYFRINPVDNEGVEYEGTILDFKTLPRPKVSNVKLQQMKNTAESTMLITWESNTEISSIVSYYPEGRIEQLKDEVNINLVTGEHKMYIKGLMPETNYALIVKGFDKLGNEARSDLQRFTTATDTRPPSVLDVSVESESEKADSNDPLTKNKSRIIVSWTTDEPATSRVEFAEGSGDIYTMKTTEDTNLKTNHLVIISGLSSNKVYHLRAVSKDTAANTGTSSDLITITPKYSDNAVDLILTNLKDMFSF